MGSANFEFLCGSLPNMVSLKSLALTLTDNYDFGRVDIFISSLENLNLQSLTIGNFISNDEIRIAQVVSCMYLKKLVFEELDFIDHENALIDILEWNITLVDLPMLNSGFKHLARRNRTIQTCIKKSVITLLGVRKFKKKTTNISKRYSSYHCQIFVFHKRKCCCLEPSLKDLKYVFDRDRKLKYVRPTIQSSRSVRITTTLSTYL